jgi:16S rRNA (guanine(966)-N(2))-methyltransferase RsmD
MSIRIYGNRELKTLAGLETRPTPARVRQALFNIWQGQIADCRWLDLCSGSGAMGAEALCRGASVVVGIEKSSKAGQIVEYNWHKIANTSQGFQLLRGDIVQKLATLEGQQFDRIYFDPPYAADLYTPVLTAIATYHLLAPNGEIAVEHSPDLRISTLPDLTADSPLGSLEICREKNYGNTSLTFYRWVVKDGD